MTFAFRTDYPSPLDERQRRAHKLRNWLHTWLLVSGSILLLVTMTWLLAGGTGLVWIAIAGGLALLSASRITPDLILRLYRARPLPANVFREGNELVAALSARAGLSKPPRLYYVASSNMNAFAVGRPENAAIAVTDGLIRGLNLRQFAGVMAHEISHIRNGDVKVMAIADMVHRMMGTLQLVGFIMLFLYAPSILSGGAPFFAIALLIGAPMLTGLLQLALNRTREYEADLDAAGLTGDPEGLASALQTLERKQGALWERLMAPGGGRLPDPSLLRTHPRTEDRVARLMSLRKPATPPDFADHDSAAPHVPNGSVPVVSRPRIHRTGVWY